MAETTHQILCGACKVPVEPIANSKPESWGCPDCGIADTRENIIREAKDHAVEIASLDLQKAMKNVARKSKFISFKGKTTPKAIYKFIIGDEIHN